MTRLFREGRTETVRSCSNESCAFVQALEAGEVRMCMFTHTHTQPPTHSPTCTHTHNTGIPNLTQATQSHSPFLFIFGANVPRLLPLPSAITQAKWHQLYQLISPHRLLVDCSPLFSSLTA